MESAHFEVVYAQKDEAFAWEIARKADRVYAEVTGRFGWDGMMEEGKIALTICGSAAGYMQATGKRAEEYQPWMVGNSDFARRRITILSPEAAEMHTPQEIEKVLVHEIIHMVFDTYAGNQDAPIWCAEGIAVLYAGQFAPEYVEEAAYPEIGELLDEETFAERGGYDYAAVYAWYFIERYGFAEFLRLYRNAPESAALLHEGFEKEAIRTMKAQYPGNCKKTL